MKTCPGCAMSHAGMGVYCSRACFNRSTKTKRVAFTCQHCAKTLLLKPSEAAKRKFCSQKCNGSVTRNATREGCRKGGQRGMQARHKNWWQRMMQALDKTVLSKAEAFREGYVIGYRRARNKWRKAAVTEEA